MRVLLIKTSSMGDVLHVLPALTDAGRAIPGIQFDWVVEEAFAEIPRWHPLVDTVIPVALRRWRKNLFAKETKTAWRVLRGALSEHSYDIILDAQGLMKSAFLGLFARGERVGLDFRSARESFASLMYQRKCTVNFYQHAVLRMRSLFSQALGYPLPVVPPDFGLNRQRLMGAPTDQPYLVFLHGTTWGSKQWPEMYWQQLANLAARAGLRIKISGGNANELARAGRIASATAVVDVLPPLSIVEMAQLLLQAKAVIAVDTGFGHLAAALDLPTVSIYGATNAAYTGAIGHRSLHLGARFACSPCLNRVCTYRKPAEVTPACYTTIQPMQVWEAVNQIASA